MKVAHIVYPIHVDEACDAGLMLRGYYMALGQHLVNDHGYRSIYEFFARTGRFVMVDNGAAEFDEEKVPFEEIVKAAPWADEFVMPDVFRDADATFIATTDPEVQKIVPWYRRAVCPQGASLSGWISCLEQISYEMRFKTICVPKHLEVLEGGRASVLSYLNGSREYMDKDIHLLGVWENPYDEITRARQVCPRVRGIDTGAAVAYAQRSRVVSSTPRASINGDGPIGSVRLFKLNMETLERWCNNVPSNENN